MRIKQGENLMNIQASAMIVDSVITHRKPMLHNFVEVQLTNGNWHTIHFRNIKYPEPPVEELIGMRLQEARKFLREDDERAKHE